MYPASSTLRKPRPSRAVRAGSLAPPGASSASAGSTRSTSRPAVPSRGLSLRPAPETNAAGEVLAAKRAPHRRSWPARAASGPRSRPSPVHYFASIPLTTEIPMSIHTFFKSLTSTPTRRRLTHRRPPASRLCLEPLEERCLLSAVHALFDLGSPAGGPFASDRFTVADPTQNTGRRVNLPLPDALTNLSDYQDTQVLNTLDGFNLQPRLSIPFDGPIEVSSVTSQTVFLVSLGDTLKHQDHGGQVVGINQVVWDPPTNTLHVESDQLLDQHTRYALIVTSGLEDVNGQPVQASADFEHFRHDLNFGQTDDPALTSYR